MNRDLTDKWCERGILGAVLAILVAGPLATGAVRPMEFAVIEWLIVLATSLWVVRLWINPRHTLWWPPICWTVLAFVGYAVVRYTFSEIEYVARQELLRVIVYGCVFFIIINNLNRKESTHIIVSTLIILAMAISAYAIYQFASNSAKVWHINKPEQYFGRASGTYINPNHLSGFLEIILPLGLSFTFLSRLNHVYKVVFGYASLVILAGIIVSISRGGWVATAVIVVLFFGSLLFRRGFRIIAAVILILLTVSAGTFIAKTKSVQKRLNEVPIAKSPDGRFYFWPSAVEMWKDHFWIGRGPGHFDSAYREYRSPFIDAQGRPNNAHNDYLNTLAEWGTIGLGIVALTLALLTNGIVRTWPFVNRSSNDLESKRSSKEAFLLGSSLGLFAILLHSIVDFNMQIPANAITVIALMAMVSGYQRFATEKYWVSIGPIIKTLISITAGIGVCYLTIQSIRGVREQLWLARAKNSQSLIVRLTSWKNAIAVEPNNFDTTYNLGETLRLVSFDGADDYEAKAQEAMTWFQRGMELNPLEPRHFIGYGMCLDWLGRKTEAEVYFKRALNRDPNSHSTLAYMGWHYFQSGEYATAKTWFERSLSLYNNHRNRNYFATTYLTKTLERLAEEAAIKRMAPQN